MQKQDFPSMGKERAASVGLQGPARAVLRGQRRRLFLLYNKTPIFKPDQQPQRASCAAKEEVIITQAASLLEIRWMPASIAFANKR